MIPPVERRSCDTPDPVGDVPMFRSRRVQLSRSEIREEWLRALRRDDLRLRGAPRSNGFDLFWLGVIACGVGAFVAALIWGVLR